MWSLCPSWDDMGSEEMIEVLKRCNEFVKQWFHD